MNKIVELKSVNKEYGRKYILKDVELDILGGDFISIEGKSGSGKSTLLNIIGSLDDEYSGEVLFNKKDIASFTSKEKEEYRNRSIGFVFQNFYLIDELNVLENVLLPHYILNGKYIEAKKKSEGILESMEIENLYKRSVKTLSGGEKQRVAIARALINEPKILLADEPTGNLDGESSAVIHNILKEINRKGQTIILATHCEELSSLAKSRYILDGNLNIK